MIDRSRIGFTTTPTVTHIEPWHVKLFRQAIGDEDDGPVVPPTFLKAIETEHFSSAALLKLLGVPLNGVLHAEQVFEHLAPVRIGDQVSVQRNIRSVEEKKGGSLTFVVIETAYAVAGAGVATSLQTIVARKLEAVA